MGLCGMIHIPPPVSTYGIRSIGGRWGGIGVEEFRPTEEIHTGPGGYGIGLKGEK